MPLRKHNRREEQPHFLDFSGAFTGLTPVGLNWLKQWWARLPNYFIPAEGLHQSRALRCLTEDGLDMHRWDCDNDPSCAMLTPQGVLNWLCGSRMCLCTYSTWWLRATIDLPQDLWIKTRQLRSIKSIYYIIISNSLKALFSVERPKCVGVCAAVLRDCSLTIPWIATQVPQCRWIVGLFLHEGYRKIHLRYHYSQYWLL